ncbi:hypothetical protein [Kutzneria buriramensis]|uniref:Nucleotidyltransferase AbiEii toxin of type IV toxin-antitoxin system n=1 Tax=Kutzneria buriramensis TaxID=1045776 RepID=A0A3E0GWM6_9PSEU|nr:hypothetical protein [Kutzneria buriramensis]REH31121.1 nucleotidyltransferase AbiEii toxin of type IV toxin-antitoxin system [Kutzneria buriramensis]
MLGRVALPALAGEADQKLWPPLLEMSRRLPPEHAVIGGVMVLLHGLAAGRRPPARVTRDVDVLFNVEVMPGSLQAAVAVLEQELGYHLAIDSPAGLAHRYVGPAGEVIDVLAPAGVKPRPDLVTTPPGTTIEVFGGRKALQHRVVIQASYDGQSAAVVVPDLGRAMLIKASAYGVDSRKGPAASFNSRHLQDLVYLLTTVDDLDALLDALGPPPAEGHFDQAAVLDDPNHHCWETAGQALADARLVWAELRGIVEA